MSAALKNTIRSKRKAPSRESTGPFVLQTRFARSAGLYVGRFLALATGGRGVLDRLTVLKRFEPFSRDLGMMNEQILTTIVGSDEAKTLLLVEPLHGTSCHVVFSLDLNASIVQVPSTIHQGYAPREEKYTP
jgi:hypothetical protein